MRKPLLAGMLAGIILGGLLVGSAATADAAGTMNVAQNWSNDPGQYIANYGCFGVDGQAAWSGTGSLDPGQSFNFVPAYPTCAQSEIPAIAMHLDWAGATKLRVETTNPFVEPSTKLASTMGFHQIAPVMAAAGGRQQANLCMFTDPYATDAALGYDQASGYGPPVNWAIKITNVGTQSASVNLTGQETNGWPADYFPGCVRADADGDNWNDMTEEALVFLGGVDTSASPATLGSLYEGNSGPVGIGGSTVASPDPADLNSDGVIDQTDVAAVQQYVGQGNGLPIDELSPNGYVPGIVANPLCSSGVTATTFAKQAPWRRDDLDGDGCVTSHDVSMVQGLVGKALPLTTDYLAPWAVITSPNTAPAKASYVDITGFASDNALLTHVDTYVGSKLVCSDWAGRQNNGMSPQYHCPWRSVPKRPGVQTTITMKAYDNAGRTYSTTQVITTK